MPKHVVFQNLDGLDNRKDRRVLRGKKQHTNHGRAIDEKAKLTVNGRISIFFLPIALEQTTKEKSNGKKRAILR
jgi:hypothetical protein